MPAQRPRERLNKANRRCANVVGIFLARDALIRPVGAVIAEQHNEWAESRSYHGLNVLSKSRATTDIPELREKTPAALTAGSRSEESMPASYTTTLDLTRGCGSTFSHMFPTRSVSVVRGLKLLPTVYRAISLCVKRDNPTSAQPCAIRYRREFVLNVDQSDLRTRAWRCLAPSNLRQLTPAPDGR